MVSRNLILRRLSRSTARLPPGSGALVMGGGAGALGTARSLGRHGVQVWVLRDRHMAASASRYVRRSERWPTGDEDSQIDFLFDLATQHRLEGWTIFPGTDEQVKLLAQHHDALSQHFRLAVPQWDTVRWCYDKSLTYRLAAEVGLSYPWTLHPRNRAEVAAFDRTFPVVVKPAVKTTANRFTEAKAWRADSQQELLDRYDDACRYVSPDVVMIQELIPGGGEAQFSYVALCQAGQPLAWGTARRVRQYPVDFGLNSTFVETVDQPEIEEHGRRLVLAIQYTGLVEIEFKYDSRSGLHKVLDMNPRPWFWHSLGQRAGVDFPYLCWELVHGNRIQPVQMRPGIGWIQPTGDVRAALVQIRRGSLSPISYLQSLRRVREFSVFTADDPLPALVDLPARLSQRWQRRQAAINQDDGPEAP